MATETKSPDVLLLQTCLSGSVSDIQDDPDAPDGNWLVDSCGDDTDTICHVSFPTPSGNLTTGVDLQEFRILWRGSSGSNSPDALNIYLYENGSQVGSAIYSVNNPSGTAAVYSATWDASSLSNIDGSQVECYIHTTADQWPPASDATGEIGAIEWNVVYDTAGPSGNPLANSLLMTGVGT